MNKPPAKAATNATAVSKTAAKPTPAGAVKPAHASTEVTASKTTAKPSAKAVVKGVTASPVAAKPAVPAAKTVASVPNVAASAAPHASKAAPKVTPKTAPKPAASKLAAATPPPIPAPAPIANRFTDRFAPAAKPAARPMNETAELPKPVHKIDPKLANAWKGKAGRELTEPELLAMPEAEYMKDKQLDFFRARLQQQKDDLLSSAGETTEHLREDTSIVPDPVDRATIEEEHALELRTRDRERKLLKKIAQSLTRLETGE